MLSTETGTRKKLLAVGHSLMVSKGFSGMGINDVLLAASTSRGSFYHHFKSKEELGLEVLQESFRVCFSSLDRIADKEPGILFLGHFLRWSENLLDRSHGQVCLIAQLNAEVAILPGKMRAELETRTGDTLRLLAHCIELIPVESKSQECDAGQLARILYGLWMGAGLLSRVDASSKPSQETIAATKAMLSL